MRTVILTLSITLLTLISFAQSEVSLFDKGGNAVAYISTNDEWTIYLWEGKPVAYIINDGKTLHVYGFNGKHIGWYLSGIIRDHEGNVVGFKKDAVSNIYEQHEGYKGYKEYKPYKYHREYAPYQPYFSAKFSDINLNGFLYQGVGDGSSQVNKQIYDAPDPIMETDLELLANVNLTKQALFDQRTKNIQEVINQIGYYLKGVLKYDTTEYTEQYITLKSNVNKISTTPVDYSDINQYNQINVPLKNHLSMVKERLIVLQRHDIIQQKIIEAYLRIDKLKEIDSGLATQQETKLANYVTTKLNDEVALLNDFNYSQLVPYFDNTLKDLDELIKIATRRKQQKPATISTIKRQQ
ncbi:MAG: hypothetical protein J0I32_04540 [Sphingobacteriales bacterium]|nr:hypothetical protein [Sphingobacteriales bacterium]OJV98429.1 MAG: hypothetical protein BGO52_11615 [Sphingobacteriales bacterium 44-61]